MSKEVKLMTLHLFKIRGRVRPFFIRLPLLNRSYKGQKIGAAVSRSALFFISFYYYPEKGSVFYYSPSL